MYSKATLSNCHIELTHVEQYCHIFHMGPAHIVNSSIHINLRLRPHLTTSWATSAVSTPLDYLLGLLAVYTQSTSLPREPEVITTTVLQIEQRYLPTLSSSSLSIRSHTYTWSAPPRAD